MTLTQESEGNRVQLRLWPGVLIVALQFLLRFALPAVYEEGLLIDTWPNISRMTPTSASCSAMCRSATKPGVRGPTITPASR